MVPKLIIHLDFSAEKVALGTESYGAQATNFLDFSVKDIALGTVTYSAQASNFLRFFFEKFTLGHRNSGSSSKGHFWQNQHVVSWSRGDR